MVVPVAGKRQKSTACFIVYVAKQAASTAIRKSTIVTIPPLPTGSAPIVTRTLTRLDGGLAPTVSCTRTKMITRNDGVGES